MHCTLYTNKIHAIRIVDNVHYFTGYCWVCKLQAQAVHLQGI